MDLKNFNLESLSDEEIKTINGGTEAGNGNGCCWGFPGISAIIGFTLCTLGNLKNLTINAHNGFLSLFFI